MRPVLIGVQPAAGGRLALTYSIRPGYRVTVIAPDHGDTEATAEAIASAVLPIIAAALTPEGQTA